MSTSEENPYQLLGLERTADDRAIRKAYAAKVREFSPEAHPEEFKRIRAAYELLSDKDARARYDETSKDLSEYPEEVGRRLADVETFLGEDKLDLAKEVIQELVAKFPDLAVVRYRRALLLARAEAWDDAITELSWLIEREPQNPMYRLLRARIHRRLDKKPDAEAEFREAFRLSPEGPIRVALCNLLVEVDKGLEAVSLLDEGILAAEPGSQDRLELLLAKLWVCRQGKIGNSDAVVTALREVAQATGDPETARYIAGRMGETAARLFAQHRYTEGRITLADCETVHPDGQAYLAVPPKVTVPLARLGDEGRAWLKSLEPGPNSPTVPGPKAFLFLLGLLSSMGLVAVGLYLFPNPGLRWLGAVLLASGVGLSAMSLRAYLRRISSPLRNTWTVESPYLIHTLHDRIDVFPLFYLQDVKGVHNRTNGVYSGTVLTLTFFNEKNVSVQIHGEQYAESWLRYFQDEHHRAIEILGEGFLEANRVVDLIPPRLLCEVARGKLPPAAGAPAPSLWAGLRENAKRKEVGWLVTTLAISTLGIGGLLSAGGSNRVWFVSGLDVPVRVEVEGGPTLRLEPGGREQRKVATGGRHVVVKRVADDRVIADGVVEIPKYADAVIYNVLGSAPVFGRAIIYSTYSYNRKEGPRPTLYGGTELIVEHSVDYLMTEPPKSVSMSSRSSSTTRRHVGVLDRGWMQAMNMAATESAQKARALAFRVLDAEPESRDAVNVAITLIDQADPAAAFAEIEKLHARYPQSAALAATYAHALLRAGRAAPPSAASSPNDSLLRALTGPVTPARGLLTDLIASEPKLEEPKIWAARLAAATGSYRDCVRLLEDLHPRSRDVHEIVACQLASDHGDAAENALAPTAGQAVSPFELAIERAHLRLAMRAQSRSPQDARQVLRELSEAVPAEDRPRFEARFLAEAGVAFASPKGEEDMAPYLELMHAFSRGPDALIAELEKPETTRFAPTPVIVLGIAELIRGGKQDRARALYERAPAVIVPFAAIERYVLEGTDEDQLWHLRLEPLAALDLARARTLDQQGKPSQAAYARARKRDALNIWVRRALADWPAAR